MSNADLKLNHQHCGLRRMHTNLTCILPADRGMQLDLWSMVHCDLIRAAKIRAVMEFLMEIGSTTARITRHKALAIPKSARL